MPGLPFEMQPPGSYQVRPESLQTFQSSKVKNENESNVGYKVVRKTQCTLEGVWRIFTARSSAHGTDTKYRLNVYGSMLNRRYLT